MSLSHKFLLAGIAIFLRFYSLILCDIQLVGAGLLYRALCHGKNLDPATYGVLAEHGPRSGFQVLEKGKPCDCATPSEAGSLYIPREAALTGGVDHLINIRVIVPGSVK